MFGSGAKLSHWVFTHQIIIPYDLLSRFGIVAEGGDLEGNFCPPEEEIYIFLSKGPLHSTFADFHTKAQYVTRVKLVLQSVAAKRNASNIARSLRRVCKEVLNKKGAAARS